MEEMEDVEELLNALDDIQIKKPHRKKIRKALCEMAGL